MVRSIEDGILGYLDEIEGDRAQARAAVRALAAKYSYSDILRIVESAISEGAARYADILDPARAPARLRAWRPFMRDDAVTLAGWDE